VSTTVDVAVVGGGPAGLAAALRLRRAGAHVMIVEREPALGGIARHADHIGYGLREFRRVLRGPAYARRWSDLVERAGAEVRVGTTVTGWSHGGAAGPWLTLTSPAGVDEVVARAVVLATGTRERPRSARLVPGARPLGVMTTGALQQLVLHGLPVGKRAVVVGAEHVSFSAVLTLAHAGCRPVLVVTGEPRHQSYRTLRWATATRHRVPVLTGTSISAIRGRARVESVELTDLVTGVSRTIECDTVVFTGDWVPEGELARRGGLVLDRSTGAPRVDTGLRTSAPGVFAAGNLLHGAETASVCAASGAWVASAVRDWLADGRAPWPALGASALHCEAPLLWVSPSAVVPGDASVPHGHLLARCSIFSRGARVSAHQAGREVWHGRLRRTIPTRPVHLPAGWLARVRPGEPVTLRLEH